MSKVFNMVGGGGGKNISSIIITGLDSTDTVTCTKEGKSYTATWDSTAQHWEIVGLPLGTFTVTATNGSKTTTKTVLIDIAGVYAIKMSFTLWLYRDGDECEITTGGWTSLSGSQGTQTLTKNDDNMYLYSSTSAGYVCAMTIKPIGIDILSGFTKLKFDVTPKTNSTDPMFFGIGSKNNDRYVDIIGKNIPVNSDPGRTTIEIDISDITSGGYVKVSVSNATCYIHRIYLA